MNQVDKQKKYNYIPLVILRGDYFDKSYADYLFDESKKPIRSIFQDKKYKVADTEETYRAINNWSDNGLLLDNLQKNEASWRKFSMIDLVWISIIGEARKMGISHRSIKRLKEILFGYYGLADGSFSTDYLEFFISQVLIHKKVSLVIFSDGTGDFAFENELMNIDNFGLNNYDFQSYLVIDMNRLLAKHMHDKSLINTKFKNFDLTDKEIEVLGKIRLSGENEEIKIKTNYNKIKKIEVKKKKVNPENAIKELRSFIDTDKDFGEITFKKEKGKIVFAEQVEKA